MQRILYSILISLAISLAVSANSYALARKTPQPKTILVFGDSLSAAYGIPIEKGWVALLQERLRHEGYTSQVINASISGETTSGGKNRLPAALQQHQPSLVLLELGANDALRGGSLAAMRANLLSMLQMIKANHARPILIGMQIPPNYGANYTQQFSQIYSELAAQEKTPLVPFLLAGFSEDLQWFQADQLHPTADAQPKILETVWAKLKPLLQ